MMMKNTILATLCYLKRDNCTLMMHRVTKENDIHEGKWNGIGGKFKPGESPEECAVREIREEAQVTATEIDMQGVLTFPEFDGENDWYVFLFIVKEFEGDPPEATREGKLEWIPDDEILDLNLWEGDEYFLRWTANPEFFSGKFVYQDGEFKGHEVSFYRTDQSMTPDFGPTP